MSFEDGLGYFKPDVAKSLTMFYITYSSQTLLVYIDKSTYHNFVLHGFVFA